MKNTSLMEVEKLMNLSSINERSDLLFLQIYLPPALKLTGRSGNGFHIL
jgi:hypothetical protein